MGNSSLKTRLIVPLLAFVFALAFAPAAFATDLAPATGEEGEITDGTTAEDNSFGRPDLESATITVSKLSNVYTGKDIEPDITVKIGSETLTEDVDYIKFYENNVNVGTAEVWIFSYDDTDVYLKSATFKITPANIASIPKGNIKMTKEVYTGKKVKPAASITFNGKALRNGVDFTVSKGKTKKVGKSKAVITGKGNFTGKRTVTFKITKATLKNAKISDVKDRVYTGSQIKPNVKIKFNGKKLKKGRDYKLTYSRNTEVGIATVKIKGKGNFKGSRKIQFAIMTRPVGDCDASVSNMTWTGDYLSPTPRLTFKGRTLKLNKDFTVRYANNLKVGTGRVYIHGRGNFSGTRTLYFAINSRPIKSAKVTVLSTSPFTIQAVYNNRLLRNGYDYTWTFNYDDKTKKYTISLTGYGNFTGTANYTYKAS